MSARRVEELVVERGRVEGAGGAPGVAGDGAGEGPADGAIELLRRVALPRVEDERRASELAGVRLPAPSMSARPTPRRRARRWTITFATSARCLAFARMARSSCPEPTSPSSWSWAARSTREPSSIADATESQYSGGLGLRDRREEPDGRAAVHRVPEQGHESGAVRLNGDARSAPRSRDSQREAPVPGPILGPLHPATELERAEVAVGLTEVGRARVPAVPGARQRGQIEPRPRDLERRLDRLEGAQRLRVMVLRVSERPARLRDVPERALGPADALERAGRPGQLEPVAGQLERRLAPARRRFASARNAENQDWACRNPN